MAWLIVTFEVPDADPTREDPHEVAADLVDQERVTLPHEPADGRPSIASAEWED